MTTTQIRAIAVLNLPLPVPALLKTSASIITALTGNTYFPTAGPLITQLNTAQQALTTAETATKARTLGSVTVRNTARTALLTALHSAKALVQQVADAESHARADDHRQRGNGGEEAHDGAKVAVHGRTGPDVGHGETRGEGRRSPRLVRLGVEPRWGPYLEPAAVDPSSEDDGGRHSRRYERAVPRSCGDQDGPG